MRNKTTQNILLFVLALIFTTGLMYAFTALPQWLDGVIQNNVSTPGGDPAYETYRYDIFIEAYSIKWIGIVSLVLVLVFIVIGFTTRKTGWAWAGAIVLFLPVFGTFAISMFYLAGLGLFNTLLFPFIDLSFEILNLGHVVLIPYWILMWLFDLFNWHAHNAIMWTFMGSGAFIFVFSVFTWFQTYFTKQKVAKSWLYKISRHPQYLGWIIWSYGLMLYGPTLNNMKKTWSWNGSLAWLLSTMVIIGICLTEEIRMREKAGEEYDDYRNRTPFLFPIPSLVKKIIKAPMKLIIRKNRPTKYREVGLSIGLYTLIFVALSLFWVNFGTGEERQVDRQESHYTEASIDSLLAEIHKPQNRRTRHQPIKDLASIGEPAYPHLKALISDTAAVLREYSAMIAGEIELRSAIPELILALNDPEGRVSRTASQALSKMKAFEARDTLLYYLDHPLENMTESNILEVLSSLKVQEILPRLLPGLKDPQWYNRTATLHQIHELEHELSWYYVYTALEDSMERVRREAVNLILQDLPEDALPHLKKVVDDESWEVRFYAKQAKKLIQAKKD